MRHEILSLICNPWKTNGGSAWGSLVISKIWVTPGHVAVSLMLSSVGWRAERTETHILPCSGLCWSTRNWRRPRWSAGGSQRAWWAPDTGERREWPYHSGGGRQKNPQKHKVPSKEGKRFPAGEDKSDQALLHFCSGGRETEGRRRRARGGEREADRAAVWGVGGAERERKTEGGMEDYNSLNKSLWADRSELRELHAAHPTPRRLQGPSDMCKLRVERTGTTSGGM